MGLDTAIYLNPENGTPFPAEPPCIGRCREYPRPPPPRVTQFCGQSAVTRVTARVLN